jgi:hypothetical protein
MIVALIKKSLVVLIPCWTVAFLTEQMVFVLPTVVVCSLWAMAIETKDKKKTLSEFAMGRNRPNVDDDGGTNE